MEKIVKILISRGIAEVIEKPAGIHLIIEDADTQEDAPKVEHFPAEDVIPKGKYIRMP